MYLKYYAYLVQHPLVDGDDKIFKRILQLNHPHVIKMSEYIVGGCETYLSHTHAMHHTLPLNTIVEIIIVIYTVSYCF